MAASNIRLPDDSANTGKYNRVWQRAVTATGLNQQEHFFHIALGETSAVATVAASATSVTLQALNQARTGWSVYNDSETATLYVKLGATASLTSFTVAVPPKGRYVLDLPYAGVIDGIWDAASGNARVTEVSP